MNKYERLIEYVINDETAKAKSLFHDIVVEKSRGIYESLMDEDEMGGRDTEEFIDDVEADENGFTEDEDEFAPEVGGDEMAPEMGGEMGDDEMAGGMDDMDDGMGDEFGDEMGGEEAGLEGQLETVGDALENLVAEFEALMSEPEAEDEFGGDEMDDMADMEPEMDDMGAEEDMGDEMGAEDDEVFGESIYSDLEENVALTKVTKGISNKSEEGGVNKKTINNDNAGKKGIGSAGNPVNFTGTDEKGAGKVSVKDEGYTTEPNLKAVPKQPKKKGEEAGVNKKSVQEGAKRRGRPVGSKNRKRKV